MKHKSNPWTALIALLLMAVLIVCICTGCADATEAAESPGDRFVVERASTSSNFFDAFIVTDTETGARYLLVDCSYGTGLTRLEEAPGEEAVGP